MRLKYVAFLALSVTALGSAAADAKPVRRAVRAPAVASPTAGVLAANAAAIREPDPGAYLNAVQMYGYVDGAIYRLFTAPDKVSDIVLQAQEQLIAISAGDTARWVIGDTVSGTGAEKRVHILVKPFSAGLRTNVVITTNRRTYHLEMESTPRTAMAAISWRYPQEETMTKTKALPTAEPARTVLVGVMPETLRFGYAIKGATVPWRPVRAFDDGQKTYIEFPATLAQTELPPLYVMGEGGAAELCNYRLQGRFYVVDRVFASAELRLGGKRQTVVRITRTGDSHD